MNAVGIDVSKGKSMVAALRPMGEVALLPQEFLHTALGLDQMAHAILAIGEDTRTVMEATGHYHEPVAAALSAYGMYGVGETTAAQLMAEIGDVRHFPRRSSIVAFAGVDPAVAQSGKHEVQSTATTKRGSPHLRKTLYQIVCTYLRKAPEDESVYQFLDKKRGEGKPYFVYMTAAQNKFLRIYYARVKECLESFDTRQNTVQD